MSSRTLRLVAPAAIVFSLVLETAPCVAIDPLPADVAAFVGLAAKGPLDTPVAIESHATFAERFGARDPELSNPLLEPSVAAFFANGGRRCYVVRVARDSDASYIGNPGRGGDRPTGLQALASLDDVGVVCIPGVTSPAVQNAMIAHCEAAGDRICLLDPAHDASPNDALEQRQQLVSERGFAAIYYPWILVQGAGGRALQVPPSGFVAGIFARNDRERGVWNAPVGPVSTAIGLAYSVEADAADRLNLAGVNSIRSFAAGDIRVWGARTVSGDNDYKFVNVRRFLIFLESSIGKGTEWAVFEPNAEPLWQQLQESVNAFLLELWRDGALQGAKPEEAFFVRVDRTTMSEADLEAGRTVLLVGVAPLRPAEFLLLRIEHQRGGATPSLLRADCNGDGEVDITDAVFTLLALFLGEGDPRCEDACDANDDGEIDISDALTSLGVLFLGHGTIPPPGLTDCGVDPTGDTLRCETPPMNCP